MWWRRTVVFNSMIVCQRKWEVLTKAAFHTWVVKMNMFGTAAGLGWPLLSVYCIFHVYSASKMCLQQLTIITPFTIISTVTGAVEIIWCARTVAMEARVWCATILIGLTIVTSVSIWTLADVRIHLIIANSISRAWIDC